MAEPDRIPLDSSYWLRPQMAKALGLLTELLAIESPESQHVSNFIDSFEESSDAMDIEYFATVPYLLDLFEAEPKKLQNSLIAFSGSLFKASGPNPGLDESWDQVLAHKKRIGKIFLSALFECKPESELAVACISGLAAIFVFPDSAITLFRILNDQDEWSG